MGTSWGRAVGSEPDSWSLVMDSLDSLIEMLVAASLSLPDQLAEGDSLSVFDQGLVSTLLLHQLLPGLQFLGWYWSADDVFPRKKEV